MLDAVGVAAAVEVAVGVVVVGGELGGGGVNALLTAVDHGDPIERIVIVGDVVAAGGGGFGSGEIARGVVAVTDGAGDHDQQNQHKLGKEPQDACIAS